MSKKTNKSKDKEHSFWATIPGILTAIAAVITAIAGLIAALNSAGLFAPHIASNTESPAAIAAITTLISTQTSTPTVSASSVTSVTPQVMIAASPSNFAALPAGCFGQYFQNLGVTTDRVTSMELGALEVQLLSLSQINDQPIGILFTNLDQPIGGVIFRFFLHDTLFKISAVFDSSCKAIEDYSDMNNGGNKNILGNFANIRIHLENSDYWLRLVYNDNGYIVASFRLPP